MINARHLGLERVLISSLMARRRMYGKESKAVISLNQLLNLQLLIVAVTAIHGMLKMCGKTIKWDPNKT